MLYSECFICIFILINLYKIKLLLSSQKLNSSINPSFIEVNPDVLKDATNSPSPLNQPKPSLYQQIKYRTGYSKICHSFWNSYTTTRLVSRTYSPTSCLNSSFRVIKATTIILQGPGSRRRGFATRSLSSTSRTSSATGAQFSVVMWAKVQDWCARLLRWWLPKG